ncbi:MAG: hypothetical protein GY924_23710 [Planctomycetaceae bacterium]|nr:hypothetical protein [Planctomycetaceae bacterium]
MEHSTDTNGKIDLMIHPQRAVTTKSHLRWLTNLTLQGHHFRNESIVSVQTIPVLRGWAIPVLRGWAYTVAAHPKDGTIAIAGRNGQTRRVQVKRQSFPIQWQQWVEFTRSIQDQLSSDCELKQRRFRNVIHRATRVSTYNIAVNECYAAPSKRDTLVETSKIGVKNLLYHFSIRWPLNTLAPRYALPPRYANTAVCEHCSM